LANVNGFFVIRFVDFGFFIGIAVILMYFNSLDYADVFAASGNIAQLSVEVIPGVEWNVMTLICISVVHRCYG